MFITDDEDFGEFSSVYQSTPKEIS